ncbi:MAG: hypothetical protein IT424_01905 [Pirellulales bacterium]|nr:hypothetical protein [Pirellulales bacterium]
MSPRLKMRAAASPLVLAGALWGGSPWTVAAPPVHVEDAMLQEQASTTAATAGQKAAPTAADAKTSQPAATSEIFSRGPTHYHLPAPPMPRQTPPPCSPDGVCISNPMRWGWYQTRWRTFPGDLPTGLPTEAAEQPPAAPTEEGLGGPKLPTLEQEGSIAPQRGPRGAAPAAENGGGAAAPGPQEPIVPPAGQAPAVEPGPATEPAPGLETPPAGPLPELENPPAVQPPAAQPPAGEPAGDPLDPFGGGPPQPPAWLSQATTAAPARVAQPQTVQPVVDVTSTPSGASSLEIPYGTPAAAVQGGINLVPPANLAVPDFDGPNLHGDDAPPALPPGLKGLTSGASAPGYSTLAGAIEQRATPRAGPADAMHRGVTQAGHAQPMGIQLINPAAAVVVEPGAEGLQQAIYFEASDLDE